jgi:sn-glycerol 3-phosphate transport system permease protein
MIGQSPIRTFIAHAVLILGVLVVAFPIYYVLVASTHSLQTILRPPLPLVPGDQGWANYSTALFYRPMPSSSSAFPAAWSFSG